MDLWIARDRDNQLFVYKEVVKFQSSGWQSNVYYVILK